MKKNNFLLFFSAIFILGALWFVFFYHNFLTKPEIEYKEVQATTTTTKSAEKPASVKAAADLPVPYTLQGPLNNLNIHEESCEEAAALMYHYFLEGTKFPNDVITPQRANDEMLAMKAWEVKNYGSEPDLTIERLGQFMQQYYGYKYRVFKNITEDDIKREISSGHPVMVPVMTHALKNPNYGPVSVYHILVLKGYNDQNVIANDPGIRGQNIQYSWDILFQAIDAQTPKMHQGRDMVIVAK